MITFVRNDQVVWRSLPGGNVGYVLPATILCDDRDIVGLYQHTGSVCKKRTGKRGGPGGRNMQPDGWDGGHADKVWAGKSNLHLHRMGTHHTVIRSWNPDTCSYEGWYVNLETDWTRTPIGFDTRDLILDVTVDRELSSWTLKDADELQWSLENGIVTAEELNTAIAEADRVGKAIDGSLWPFGEDWSQWAPDPEWPVAPLPENWDQRWDR